jgi:hypothetical protein
VQAVAKKYLVEQQLTVAELVPLPMEAGKHPHDTMQETKDVR